MKKKIIISIVVLVLILAGYTVTQNNETGTPNSLKLGLMLPLSGEYAVAGQNVQKGVEVALKEYKEKNPSSNIELYVEDDGFEVQKGITAYKKLTEVNKIDALIMVSTPVVDAIYEEINNSDLIIMQIGIQTNGVADDNIFQTSSSPEIPIKEYSIYLEDEYDFKNIAVVYDNTAGGISFFEAFKDSYNDPYVTYVLNDKNDVRDTATKIVSEDIDAVLVLTGPENGALLVKDIFTLDDTPPQFLFDAQLQTGLGDYERILQDISLLDGSLSMWLASGGEADEFKQLYVNEYSEDPGFVADFGYDSFRILMDAYNADREEWMSAIQNTNREGAAGSISFDVNNVRVQGIVINKVVGGEIVPVQ